MLIFYVSYLALHTCIDDEFCIFSDTIWPKDIRKKTHTKVIVNISGLRIVPKVMLFVPRPDKTCLQGFANNTGAVQPAHPRSLISAFVVRFLERSIYVNYLLQVKFQFSS